MRGFFATVRMHIESVKIKVLLKPFKQCVHRVIWQSREGETCQWEGGMRCERRAVISHRRAPDTHSTIPGCVQHVSLSKISQSLTVPTHRSCWPPPALLQRSDVSPLRRVKKRHSHSPCYELGLWRSPHSHFSGQKAEARW